MTEVLSPPPDGFNFFTQTEGEGGERGKERGRWWWRKREREEGWRESKREKQGSDGSEGEVEGKRAGG